MTHSGTRLWMGAGWLLIASALVAFINTSAVLAPGLSEFLAAAGWLLLALAPSPKGNFFFGDVVLTVSVIATAVLILALRAVPALAGWEIVGTALQLAAMAFLVVGAVSLAASARFPSPARRAPLYAVVVAVVAQLAAYGTAMVSGGFASPAVQISGDLARFTAAALPIFLGVLVLLHASRRAADVASVNQDSRVV